MQDLNAASGAKICKCCSKAKPLEQFSVARHHKSGRNSYCRPCKASMDRARYAELKQQPLEWPDQKRCCHCHQTKPASEFYIQRQSKTNLSGRCRACSRERENQIYSERVEHERELRRRRYRANPSKALTAIQRYWERFPERRSAHLAVKQALKTGRLVRPPHCQCCGVESDVLEGHHADYTRPLSVLWLCTFCHRRLHFSTQPIHAAPLDQSTTQAA